MMCMQEEWKDVYDQLKCADQFYACWHCPAGRVIHCVVLNCETEIRDRIRKGMGFGV